MTWKSGTLECGLGGKHAFVQNGWCLRLRNIATGYLLRLASVAAVDTQMVLMLGCLL